LHRITARSFGFNTACSEAERAISSAYASWIAERAGLATNIQKDLGKVWKSEDNMDTYQEI